jgi:flagellar assembly protein FliH
MEKKMSDSNHEASPSAEKAQPFLYGPPSGEMSRSLAAGDSLGFGRHESAWGTSSSEQTIKKAHEKGVAEGETRARAECEKEIAEVRSQISGALRDFAKDRADYFSRVEAEVVRLSLSIARKILHRESQIDPLVLTGVVHVALQKLNSETRVRLHAHPDEVRLWNDYNKQSKDLLLNVDVVGDPSLIPGQCTLETEVGTTQISLETQLKEIEQGLFDLLEQRPKEQE